MTRDDLVVSLGSRLGGSAPRVTARSSRFVYSLMTFIETEVQSSSPHQDGRTVLLSPGVSPSPSTETSPLQIRRRAHRSPSARVTASHDISLTSR